MLVISSELLVSVLVSVTGCAALVAPTVGTVKVRAGDRVANPDGARPVPVSIAVTGLTSSVLVTDNVAERTPVAVGPNVTLTVQLAAAAKVVPQVPPAVPAGRTNTPAVVGMIGATAMFMAVSGTASGFVNVSVCGALVVRIVWDGKGVAVESVGGGTRPVMATFSAAAELRTLRLVVRVPMALGVNVTLIVQLAPAAKFAPQVLVCAKSVVFPVLSPMLVISSEPLVAVLVSVTGCETPMAPRFWVKVRAGDRVADADGARPVPVSTAVAGLARPATATDSIAERTPAVVGLNVTLMVQLKPGAKLVPQVPPPVRAGRTNTPAVVGRIGVSVMFMVVSGTVPVLDNVTVCGALVVSIVWGGKAAVDRVMDGETMVPASVTDCGEPIPAFKVSVAAF
jgi:hypothetical protein